MNIFLLFIFAVIPFGVDILIYLGQKQFSTRDLPLIASLGIASLILISFVFTLINPDLLNPLIIFGLGGLSIIHIVHNRPKLIKLNLKSLLVGLVLTIFGITNSLLIVPFGFPPHISLYGAHFVDSTWHLSLANALKNGIPPAHPLFLGASVTNYHLFSDLLVSAVSKISQASVSEVYFQYLGLILPSILSYLLYIFLRNKQVSRITSLLGTGIIMLGSNYYYLISRIYSNTPNNPSSLWVEFFTTKTVNYPLLLSLIVGMSSIIILSTKYISIKKIIVLGVLSGMQFGIKSHFALIELSLVIVIFLYFIFKRDLLNIKRVSVYSIILISTILLITGFTYSPSGNEFVIRPLWPISILYQSPDRLNFPSWELARQYLVSVGGTVGVMKLYITGLVVFLFGNFGLGISGLINLKSSAGKILALIGIISILLMLMFQYKPNINVSIEFGYFAVVALYLSSVVLINNILSVGKARLVVFLVLVSLLPGSRYLLSQYLNGARQTIPTDRLLTVDYLNKLSPGILITSPDISDGSIYSAYTANVYYLGDKAILNDQQINYNARQINVEKILSNKCPRINDRIFASRHIYIISSEKISCYNLLKHIDPNTYIYSL